MGAVLEIRDFSFAYPEQEREALSRICLAVGEGTLNVICGKSGCGKSTLLLQLKSALAPHGKKSGQIFYRGRPLGEVDLRTQSSEIGFVRQNPENQVVTDKVWHELAFGLESLGLGSAAIRLRVAEMASYFGIQNWFYKNVSELSGGQKQIVNLASVLVMHPKLLILDEPTAQLDPIAAADFLETVKRIHRELGTTVILTEHRLSDILPDADRVFVLDGGRLLAEGKPREIGAFLRETKHGMFLSMPVPMQIYAGVKSDAPCPLTVSEGRHWIDNLMRKADETGTRGAEASGKAYVSKTDEQKTEMCAVDARKTEMRRPGMRKERGESGAFSQLRHAGQKERRDGATQSSRQECKGEPAQRLWKGCEEEPAQRPRQGCEEEPSQRLWKGCEDEPSQRLRQGCGTGRNKKSPPAIQCKDVWFRYEKDGSDVVRDFSLVVAQGEFYALVGANGTGKSTALSLLSGVHTPYRGQIFLNGKEIRCYAQTALYRGYLGVLPQNPQSMFLKKTVREDLYAVIGGRREKKSEEYPVELKKTDAIHGIASLTNLEGLLDRHPYDLSGGEQQRLALAKVLLLRPRLLLLDEPTKGMDGEYKREFGGILKKLQEHGITILMVSHDVEFVAEYADRAGLFFEGSVVTSQGARQMFAGNSFYTTAANRMARQYFPDAVTGEEVIACLREKT